MALTMGQRPVGTAPVFLAQIPPGPGQLTVTSGTAAAGVITIGLGTTSSGAISSGYPLPSGGLQIQLFSGSAANQLYAICAASPGTAPVSWIVSVSYGLAQPGVQ